MKRTLTTILLTLGLVSSAALADIAVYSGTVGAKQLAGGDSKSGVVKTFVVVDLATSQAQSIEYFKFFIFKRYAVTPGFSITKATVKDKKGKTTTAFAYANTTDNGDSSTFKSVLFSGVDSQVDIGTGASVTLPKQLKGASYVLDAADEGLSTDENQLATASSVLKLDVKWSKKANTELAMSLDQTIAALTAFLESKQGGKYESEND